MIILKIERINEDQISCTLTSGDLDIRNMKLNDLGYGSYQARTLCKEMLRRAASELGFETDENPIMVETIPMADNSIVMIITKVEDPEEMDARFSTFTPENLILFPEEGEKEMLEGVENLYAKGHEVISSIRIFSFKDLDTIVCAAKAIHGQYNGTNTLYKNNDQYLLVISNDDVHGFSITCNILSEYGRKVNSSYASTSFLEEHCEIITRGRALQVFASLY